ncbi:MAG: hypothetical protein GY807_10535 [Gammaproteobacteria bacterium]|nr:hypothetical protein [Gammaproteobacteria bacterium]
MKKVKYSVSLRQARSAIVPKNQRINIENTMKKYLIFLASIFLMGCAAQHLVKQRMKLVQEGFSDTYIDGYIDGCSSGYNRADNYQYDFTRDMPRYQSDQLYSSGWEEGYKECKSEHESLEEVFNTLSSD